MLKETFVEEANKAYAAEIEEILYEGSGQRKLIFINTDIFSAFNDISNGCINNLEEIKRGIAKGFGKAAIAIIELCLSEYHNIGIENKQSEQIFYGQFNQKKGKLQLWLEVVVFYTIQGEAMPFSYKFNIDNQSISSEDSLSKLTERIAKSINKQLREGKMHIK